MKYTAYVGDVINFKSYKLKKHLSNDNENLDIHMDVPRADYWQGQLGTCAENLWQQAQETQTCRKEYVCRAELYVRP